MPTRVINMQTPLERLLHETPDCTFFKNFGCACWPNLRPYSKHKLQFRSQKYVFLGYSPLHKGYKFLHIPTNRVYISRDVVFDENVFPFSNLPSSQSSSSTSLPVAIDQFEDCTHAPLLLPNHGADTGRGARLEIHEESSSPPPSPRSPVQDDRMDEAPSMQPHGTPASAREPGPEDGSGPSVRISPRRVSPGVSTGAPSARATDALAGSASHAHEPGSASPVHARGEQPSHVRSDSTRLTSPVRPDPTSPMMDITSPSTASGKPGTITQSPRVAPPGAARAEPQTSTT
jgi:hypothetical protein